MRATLQLMKNTFKSNSTRWTAIETRNHQADGYFFYGVKTTGIYCRPSCSSRKPKYENVDFFLSITQAENAGYRPCKKCQPNSLPREIILVKRICELINKNEDKSLTLSALSEKIKLSPFYLQRVFKRNLGMSPRQYQESIHTHRLKTELLKGKKIIHAIHDAGFESSSSAYAKIKNHLGMRPADYQHQGKGTVITFTIFNSPIGKILLAATEYGVCRIDIGNNIRKLIKNLNYEFSNATIKRDDKELEIQTEKIISYLKGSDKKLDFSVALNGTIFQKKVWEILRAIPYGETRSYTEIADAIGAPNAIRAVASAIANNAIALAIPCHRVIRKNGELADYRWGVNKKMLLLKKEGAK